ncbi:hypothetical protein OG369_09865 [Streptomyces sp. NBC_01221]|uniref:hypothetical protein n=1 Tax=Streptomyces sp. NBC_01221 TaxID=2903782 RepID=UPI0022533F7D|nr:hypothetical protein [Streptomyces sp. NBC_01221]MCX4786477.1 hypothetical protein [Streptomyces sp. NBC_01221]
MADREHFWFMSLALITHEGLRYYRRTGVFTAVLGATRFDCFEEILASVKEQTPELQDAVVLAFDVQPNHLTA